MKEKHSKFLDFIFNRMKDNYGDHTSFMDMAYYYKKEHGIEITSDDTKYLEDKFFNDLFTPIGNVGAFELTPKAIDLIEQFGSYTNYILSLNKEFSNDLEIKELEKKNLQLDIENKEYLKTIRSQDTEIRKLKIRLSKFELFKNYQWLIGIVLAIVSFILGDLLNVLEKINVW